VNDVLVSLLLLVEKKRLISLYLCIKKSIPLKDDQIIHMTHLNDINNKKRDAHVA
jgi:hypothetical protein